MINRTPATLNECMIEIRETEEILHHLECIRPFCYDDVTYDAYIKLKGHHSQRLAIFKDIKKRFE